MMHPETRDVYYNQVQIIENVLPVAGSFTYAMAVEISEPDDTDLLKASASAGTFNFLIGPTENIY